MKPVIPTRYFQFANLGKQVLSLVHHVQAYDLAFAEGDRFLIKDEDIVSDIMELLTAKNSAGFDRMATLYFNGDRSFSGIVEDIISPRLTKRYAFRANDKTLQYRLVNAAAVENFSETEVWDFAKTKAPKKKQAKCIKGVPCEPICLRSSYVCLHDFNEQQKKILKSAQSKALRLKAKAELKGEKFTDYDIDRSDPQAAAKLGKQFISSYITSSQPSEREKELEKRQKQIKKEIAKAKKDGKYNPKELLAEATAVEKEYKQIKGERTTRLEDEMFVLRKALIAHQGISEGTLDQLAQRLKFEESVPAAKVDKIKEDLKGFYALTGIAGHDNLKSIEFSSEQAFSNLKEGRLNIGGYVTDDRLWNQAARHWEYGAADLNKAATEWRKQRATSANPVKLNSLVKEAIYGDDEVAFKGNYIDPYLGKVHGGAGAPTEVLAMGLERLSNAKRMAGLYKKDPEFLEFLVGNLVATNNAPLPELPELKIDPNKKTPKSAQVKKTETQKTETQKTEPQKPEEEAINYKIDNSNPQEVIGLGEKFAQKHFKYASPSQTETDLRAKAKDLRKQFVEIQKAGGGAPPKLVKDMMAAKKAYRDIADKRKADMRKQLRNLTSEIADKHGLSDAEIDAMVKKVSFTSEASADQQSVQAALKSFYRLTGKAPASLKYIGKDKPRAYANKDLKFVNIGEDSNDRILTHEFTHHFEFSNPALYKAAEAWRDSRASGPPEKLSVLLNNASYEDKELAYPDKFIHAYVGKVYDNSLGATEVFSMGVERFISADKLLEFYEKDSQHFHLTLGALLADK